MKRKITNVKKTAIFRVLSLFLTAMILCGSLSVLTVSAADNVYAYRYVGTNAPSGLNLRESTSTSSRILYTMPIGFRMYVWQCFTVNGIRWAYADIWVDGTNYFGYCDSQYLAVSQPAIPAQPIPAVVTGNTSALAQKILNNRNIELWTYHQVSGVRDNASAYQNIVDTANGRSASRSNYQNAPGGSIQIKNEILEVMLLLSDRYGKMIVTEIAGASHSVNSWHYQGYAFDIGALGGRALTQSFANEIKTYLQGQGYKFRSDPVWESSHLHIAVYK